MKKIEHLPINWVNGLKLTNRHFFETYYNMVETMRMNREENLTDYNYGFGESMDNSPDSIKIEVKGDSVETFNVCLKSCNAVTREGYHIVYTPSLYGDYTPTARLCDVEGDVTTEQILYIILSVNPYKLLPVGIPDTETVPLHHPYALPEINLQFVLGSRLNNVFMERNCIIAGKCIAEGNRFAVDELYIPPVQKVCYSKSLVSFNDFLTSYIKSIHDYSLHICRKNVRDHRRDTLVENTLSLCKVIQHFYSDSIFDMEHQLNEMPPVYMVRLVNRLANMLLSALRSMPEKEFEVLLQYYNEWINVKPSEFMGLAEEVAGTVYRHTDIRQSLLKLQEFITTLERLFRKISELEYVGLMRDNIIVSEDKGDNRSDNGHKSLSVWE
ncbi:MAG: hypothetical protein SPI30_10275 [Prevotella sp.]|nr:hypothetical protein [Prevotella sp.]